MKLLIVTVVAAMQLTPLYPAVAVEFKAPPGYKIETSFDKFGPDDNGCSISISGDLVYIPTQKEVVALPKITEAQRKKISAIYHELNLGFADQHKKRKEMRTARMKAWATTRTILTDAQFKSLNNQRNYKSLLQLRDLTDNQRDQIKKSWNGLESDDNILDEANVQYKFAAGELRKIESVLNPAQLSGLRKIQALAKNSRHYYSSSNASHR